MTLEERVKSLEDDYWLNVGRLNAMLAAIVAIAGEDDPEMRPALVDDLIESAEATLLNQSITDEQLDLVRRSRAQMTAALQRGFAQARVRREFRQPLRRVKPLHGE